MNEHSEDTMRALSAAQEQAAQTHAVPDIERIRENVWSVPVPMPGDFLSYTLSVLVRDERGGFSIVDPGSPGEETLQRWKQTLAPLGGALTDVHTLVLTHSHPDHLGVADAFREASGATVVIHEREHEELHTPPSDVADTFRRFISDWGLPAAVVQDFQNMVTEHHSTQSQEPLTADVLVREGDFIAGTPWQVIDTPGHTAGHVCLVDEAHELLVAGDHVLPTLNPGVGLSGTRTDENAIVNFFTSLEKLAPYDHYEVLPGHGYRFTGLRARRTQQAAHVQRRASEVEALTRSNPELTVWEIASQLTWTAGWEKLQTSPMLLFSGLAQTALYRDAVVNRLLRTAS